MATKKNKTRKQETKITKVTQETKVTSLAQTKEKHKFIIDLLSNKQVGVVISMVSIDILAIICACNGQVTGSVLLGIVQALGFIATGRK